MTSSLSTSLKAFTAAYPILLSHKPYQESLRLAILLPLSSLAQLSRRLNLLGMSAMLLSMTGEKAQVSCAPYPKEKTRLTAEILEMLAGKIQAQNRCDALSIFVPHPAGLQAQYHLPHIASEFLRLAGCQENALLVEISAKEQGEWLEVGAVPLDSFDVARELVLQKGLVHRVSSTYLSIPEKVDGAKITVYQDASKQLDYVVLDFSRGQSTSSERLVRMHSSCMTGDIFQSLHCDCGLQLKKSLSLCAEHEGLLLYLPQEGRGLGLADKLSVYELQASGEDTVTANAAIGHDADERFFGGAVEILQDQGVKTCILISNNPNKVNQLRDLGMPARLMDDFAVDLISEKQKNYLKTKQKKLNHQVSEENHDR